MQFINNIRKRIFSCFLDAYFVFVTFSESLDEIEAELPSGYTVRAVGIDNSEKKQALVKLWLNAYYNFHVRDTDLAEADISRLAQSKNTCFGLFFGEKLVGMHWVGYEDAINAMEFTRILKAHSNAAVMHHVFILSDHRGNKLQNPMMIAGKQAAKRLGRTAIFTFVGVRNFASVRNMMECSDGYQLIYHLKIDLPFCTFNLFPGSDISNLHACEKKTLFGS